MNCYLNVTHTLLQCICIVLVREVIYVHTYNECMYIRMYMYCLHMYIRVQMSTYVCIQLCILYMHVYHIILGLFEVHKLLFSFQMTIKIQEVEEHLKHEELDFFIKGNISLEKSAHVKPFSWIPDQGWEDIIKLSEISADVFGSLPGDVEKNEQAWKDVCMCMCTLMFVHMCVYVRTYQYACTHSVTYMCV